MSSYRKPFSPVDANKKSSRSVSIVNRKTVKSSSTSTPSLASTRTAESFADDSEFDFLSKEKTHSTKVAQLSHFDEQKWNSRSKTPRISNLWGTTTSESNEPTTTVPPAVVTKAHPPTKPNKGPLQKKKLKLDVSTKVRFQSRNLIDTEHRSVSDQTSNAEQRSSRLPPHPEMKRRRRNILKTNDSTSILQRGVALETIAEDTVAEERLSPKEVASVTSTNFGSDTPLISLAASSKLLESDKQLVSQPWSRVDLGSASPSLDHPQSPVFATQPSPDHCSYAAQNAKTDTNLQIEHDTSDMDESPGGDLLELTLSPPPTSENCIQPTASSSTPHRALDEKQAQRFGPTESNGEENALPIETWTHRPKRSDHLLPDCVVSHMNEKKADPHHERPSPVDTNQPPFVRPELQNEREMQVPSPKPVCKQDRKNQQQTPIDKEVWLAMTAPPERTERSAFPIGILVPTPGCSSGGDASVDGSELTPDTSLHVRRMNVNIPKYAFPNNVGRNLLDAFKDINSEQSSKKAPFGNSVAHMDTKRQEQNRGMEIEPQGLDQERQRIETSSVLSITKPLLRVADIPKSVPRGTTPALWTTEHAGTQYKELGVNLAPIFRLNGKCFQHPPLPPGWTISISRSKNIPFYNHPTFGSTFYSPVPLPSNEGNILGATILLQTETPMETLGVRVQDRILDTCVTPADQKASKHVMIKDTVVPFSSRSRSVLMTPELFSGISSLVRDFARGDPITVLRQRADYQPSVLTMAWGSTDHRSPSLGLMTPISKVKPENGKTTTFHPSSEPTQDSRSRNDPTSTIVQSDTNSASHLPSNSAKEWDCHSRQSSLDEQVTPSRSERLEDNDHLFSDQIPDCPSLGLPSSASRSYRVDNKVETSTRKKRDRFGVPSDIVVVNKPSMLKSTDKFTMDLDVTAHMSRKTRAVGHGAVMASPAGNEGPSTPELHSSTDNSSGYLSIESKLLKSSTAQIPTALDLYSLQEQCITPMVGSAHSSSAPNCGQVDPFSTPGGPNEVGTVKQRKYNTPYISKRSTEVENLSKKESVNGTAITVNIFSPSHGSDFADLQGDDDNPTEESQLSPTIPTRVIVACRGDDDSMSHMQSTPVFRPEPGKISTRYKPTAILPDSFEEPVATFEDHMEDRTIRSYGSMNSQSCNSSLSRASHRAMNPTLPLCALRKVLPSEDEESILVAYIRKRKRMLEAKSKPKQKKKARKTKHVSPDDSSIQ